LSDNEEPHISLGYETNWRPGFGPDLLAHRFPEVPLTPEVLVNDND
jgi:hypothetical protein